MLDVEFEWFDPQPEHDFPGLKTLLRQLFDVDAQLFDLSAMAELILAQPLLGSTVKVDGNETDPYAFLTVLNLQEHQVWQKAGVLQMQSYSFNVVRRKSRVSAIWSNTSYNDVRLLLNCRRSRASWNLLVQLESGSCSQRD